MRCSHYRSTEHPSPPTPSSPPITTKPTKYTGQTMESDFSSFVLIGSSFCSSFFVFSPFPHSWAHHSPSSPSCSHSSHQSSSVRPFNTPVTIKSMRELRQWSMTVASIKRLTRERDHLHITLITDEMIVNGNLKGVPQKEMKTIFLEFPHLERVCQSVCTIFPSLYIKLMCSSTELCGL